MTQCENCLHKKICDLWRENEGTSAGGYSIGDTCDYFDGWMPTEGYTPTGQAGGRHVGYSMGLGTSNQLYAGWSQSGSRRKSITRPWRGRSVWRCDREIQRCYYETPMVSNSVYRDYRRSSILWVSGHCNCVRMVVLVV